MVEEVFASRHAQIIAIAKRVLDVSFCRMRSFALLKVTVGELCGCCCIA